MSSVLGELMKRGIDFTEGKIQPYSEGVEIVPGLGRSHYAMRMQTPAPVAAADITGTAVTTLKIPNPLKRPVLVTRAILLVLTESTGACTLDIGVTPTAAPVNTDNLIDGLSVAAAGVFDNLVDGGTNGLPAIVMQPTDSILIRQASGSAAGLVAVLLCEYVPIDLT